MSTLPGSGLSSLGLTAPRGARSKASGTGSKRHGRTWILSLFLQLPIAAGSYLAAPTLAAACGCAGLPNCGCAPDPTSGGPRGISWIGGPAAGGGLPIEFTCPPGMYVPTPGFGENPGQDDCIPIPEISRPRDPDEVAPDPSAPADSYDYGGAFSQPSSPAAAADDRTWPPACPPEAIGGCSLGTESYSVNKLSGDFTIDATDLVVRGLDGAQPVVIQRTYASRNPHGSPHFGGGWRGLYDIRLYGWERKTINGMSWTQFKLQWPNRRTDLFTRIIDDLNAPQPPCVSPPPPTDWRWASPGHSAELHLISDLSTWQEEPENFAVRFRDGTTWTFQTISAGLPGEATCPTELSSQCDGAGRRILACGIMAQVSRMTDRFGNEIRFFYSVIPGREHQLEQIIDTRNRVTTVSWREHIVENPNGGNSMFWLVDTVTAPDGRTVTYEYWQPGETYADGSPATGFYLKAAVVTGLEERRREYQYRPITPEIALDGTVSMVLSDNILEIRDSTNSIRVKVEYDEDTTYHEHAFDPSYFPLPENGEPLVGGPHAHFQHGFDRVTKLKEPASGEAWAVTNFHYEQLIQRPDYPDDEVHPELGFKVGPAPVKRTFINDPLGRVTEYRYNKRNNLIQQNTFTGFAPDPTSATTGGSNQADAQTRLRLSDPPKFMTAWTYDEQSCLWLKTLPSAVADPASHPYPEKREYTGWWRYPLPYGITGLGLRSFLPASRGDAEGNLTGFRYETAHLPPMPTVVDDPPNAYGFITHVTDPNSNVTEYIHDPTTATLTTILHPEPNTREDFTYNSRGQRRLRTMPRDKEGRRRVDEWRYFDDPAHASHGWLEATVVDKFGLALTTTYEYDAEGNVQTRVGPDQARWEAVYNEVGQPTFLLSPEIKPGEGVRYDTTFRYDISGSLQYVDVGNLDENGLVRAELPVITTEYVRDPVGRVIAVVQPVDATTKIRSETVRDLAGQVLELRTPLACEDDPLHCGGEQPDAKVLFTHDERGLVLSEATGQDDPIAPGVRLERRTTHDYDIDGFLAKTTVTATDETERVTLFRHDGAGALLETTDPMGNKVVRTFDPSRNLKTEDIFGELLDQLGSAGNLLLATRYFAHDKLNRQTTVGSKVFDPASHDPLNPATWAFRELTTSFAPNGQVEETAGPISERMTLEYDSAGRVRRESDVAGNSVQYTYLPKGQLETRTTTRVSTLGGPPLATLETQQHDGLGRLSQRALASGLVQQLSHDSLGRLIVDWQGRSVAGDSLARVTRYQYDALGRLLTTIREIPVGSPISLGHASITTTQKWDANSRLTEQLDPNGNKTSYSWSPLGKRYRVEHEDLSRWTYRSSAFGELIEQTDPNGTTLSHARDLLGRLTRSDATPGPGVSDSGSILSFEYDGEGRVRSAVSTDLSGRDEILVVRRHDSQGGLLAETLASTARTLDGAGNVLSEDVNSWTTSYQLDLGGRVVNLDYPSGKQLARVHDNDGRLSSLTLDGELLATYDYLGAGAVQRRSLGNGVVEDWSFDLAGRPDLFLAQVGCPDCQQVAILDTAHDEWNSRTMLERPLLGSNRNYQTDALNRLAVTFFPAPLPGQPGVIDYSLDRASNRTSVSTDGSPALYTMLTGAEGRPDREVNQYSRTPLHDQIHDENGNIESWHLGLVDERYFTYDHRNLLVSTTDAASGVHFDYLHDAFGRRVGVRSPTETAWQLWDGFVELEEYIEPTGGVPALHSSLVSGDAAEMAVYRETDGVGHYIHQDINGSCVAATDINGSVAARYDYADFGEASVYGPTGVPGASDPLGGRHLFHGKRLDAATSLYYNRLRMYDAAAGRFTSRDPLGMWGDGVSLGNGYRFGLDNPTLFGDPLGTDPRGFVIEGVHVSMDSIIARDEAANARIESFQQSVTQVNADAQARRLAPDQRASSTDRELRGAAEPSSRALDEQQALALSGNSNMSTSGMGGRDVVVTGAVGLSFTEQLAYEAIDFTPVGTMEPIADEGLSTGQKVAVVTAAATVAVLAGTKIGAFFKRLFGKSTDAARGGARAVDANKLHHIFDKAGRNLDDVVKAAGSREAAFGAMEKAAQGAFDAGKLAGTKKPGVFEGPISVGGVDVTVRGAVVDGVFMIGSAWR